MNDRTHTPEFTSNAVRFQAVLDGVFANVVVFDLDGRIVGANKAALETAGVSREEMIDELVENLELFSFSADSRTHVRSLVRRAAAGEELRDLVRARSRSGQEFVMDLVFGPLRDEQGNIDQVIASGVDITERLEALEAAERNRTRMEEAQRVAKLGSWEHDLRTDEIWWSPETYAIFGLDPALPVTMERLLEPVHPDDRDASIAAYRTAVANNVPHDFEHRIVLSDGTIKHVRSMGIITYDEQNQPMKATGTVQDLTHAVNADRMLRTAIDGMPIFIAVCDTDGVLLEINAPPLNAVGANRDDVLGLRFEELPWFGRFPEEKKKFKHVVREVCKGHVVTEVFQVHVGQDEPAMLEGTWAPLRDHAGKIHRIIGSGVNITERLEAEKRQRQLEEQVARTQKLDALGTLAGGIAHDFNNLLTAISGNLELARTQVEPETFLSESLDEIDAAATRAADLVRQVLAFGRPQSERRVVIELGPIIDEVVRLLRVAAPKGIEFIVDDRDHSNVSCDPSQIHQVLMNLGTNAWQAIEPENGTVTFQISTESFETSPDSQLDPGVFTCIRVVDSGCGMDQETVTRAFEPFFTTKPVGRGTGLGLSVSHGIIAAHQGALRFRSQVERGTTVEILLPVTLGRQDQPTPAPNNETSGKGRVMLIDDEPSITRVHDRMLTLMGYTVSSFNRAEEALDRLRSEPHGFDVVVTDHNMPDMSGTAVARAVTDVRDDLPVVLVSGNIPFESDELAERNIAMTLNKPYSTRELSDIIDALIV